MTVGNYSEDGGQVGHVNAPSERHAGGGGGGRRTKLGWLIFERSCL